MNEQPESDLSIVEDAGVAFDPGTQHLDLSKEEKRRTTALMMAIQAYRELIIKEAAYLEKAADLARRDEGPKLRPATIDAMVDAAIKFDDFISGSADDSASSDDGRHSAREMESEQDIAAGDLSECDQEDADG